MGRERFQKRKDQKSRLPSNTQLWTSLGYLRSKILSCLQPLFVPLFTVDFIMGFFLTDSLLSLMVSSSVSRRVSFAREAETGRSPKGALTIIYKHCVCVQTCTWVLACGAWVLACGTWVLACGTQKRKKKTLHESFSPSTKGILSCQVLSSEPSYHPSHKILDAPFNSSANT